MAHNLPYMLTTSLIPKILEKIREAKTPDRFTKDFLASKLGVKSSAARPFLPFAKRIGLLNADGTPSALYKAFRSTDGPKSGGAIAEALRKGYADLYARNENAHTLTDDKLKGLVIEETGLQAGNRVVSAVVGSFKELRKVADFRAAMREEDTRKMRPEDERRNKEEPDGKEVKGVGLNLAYTINLVLPKTDDSAVFNAIFKSLRDNLLR